MKDKLINVWKELSTHDIAMLFKAYVESKGYRKIDNRRKDNNKVYIIDGDSTNWNRVECYIWDNGFKWGEQVFGIVLRKKSGDYLIVSHKDFKRAFEISFGDIINYDEVLLAQAYSEHKEFFDSMFKLVNR